MRTKEHYLLMIGTALMEIRAAKEIETTRKISDIFHGVPIALTRDWTPEAEQELRERIKIKAEDYGLGLTLKNIDLDASRVLREKTVFPW